MVSEVYALVGDIFHSLLPKKELERDSFDKIVVHMTEEYMLFVCFDIILVVALKDIDSANTEDYIDRLHLQPLIPVKVIDMRQMFDSDSID